MKVFSRVLAALVALVVVGIVGAMLLMWPDGTVSAPGSTSKKDVAEVFREGLDASTLEVSIPQAKLSIKAFLSDAQVNEMLDVLYRVNKEDVEFLSMITGYQAWTMDGFIRIKANLSFLGLIPAQATMDAVPAMNGGKLELTVRSLRLGRIDVPVERAFDMAGIKDDGTHTISLPIEGLGSNTVIQNPKVSRGQLTAELIVTVRNMNDLQQLARSLSTEIYQRVMEAVAQAAPAATSR